MFCIKCSKEISDCTCPDINQRMKEASNSPYISMRWCAKCDSHYSKCKCENPDWKVRTNGELR